MGVHQPVSSVAIQVLHINLLVKVTEPVEAVIQNRLPSRFPCCGNILARVGRARGQHGAAPIHYDHFVDPGQTN